MRTECCCLLIKHYFVSSFFSSICSHFILHTSYWIVVSILSAYVIKEKKEMICGSKVVLGWVIKARFITITYIFNLRFVLTWSAFGICFILHKQLLFLSTIGSGFNLYYLRIELFISTWHIVFIWKWLSLKEYEIILVAK